MHRASSDVWVVFQLFLSVLWSLSSWRCADGIMEKFSTPDLAENYISRSMGRVGCEYRHSGFNLVGQFSDQQSF